MAVPHDKRLLLHAQERRLPVSFGFYRERERARKACERPPSALTAHPGTSMGISTAIAHLAHTLSISGGYNGYSPVHWLFFPLHPDQSIAGWRVMPTRLPAGLEPTGVMEGVSYPVPD